MASNFAPLYIFALSPHLTHVELPKVLRRQGGLYGSTILKLALLHGFTPVLSEAQIVDTSSLLYDAADSPDFVQLIESGDIRLTIFTDSATDYRSALSSRLSGHWSSSAWAKVNRKELLRFLEHKGPMRGWDADAEHLYEGLATLDGLLGTSVRPERARIPTVSFSQRVRRFYTTLENVNESALAETAANTSALLRGVQELVPPNLVNLASLWIDTLGSPAFVDRNMGLIKGGAIETAMTALVLLWNEVVAQSIASGVAARSIALPLGDEEIAHDVVSALIQIGSSNQSLSRTRVRPMRRRFLDFILPPTLEPRNKYLTWSVVRKVRAHPKFKAYASDAFRSKLAAQKFDDWLREQVGSEAVLEFDAAKRPLIRIAGHLLTSAVTLSFKSLELATLLFGRSTFAETLQKPVAALAARDIAWRARGAMGRTTNWFWQELGVEKTAQD
jgi:hypothetical protein